MKSLREIVEATRGRNRSAARMNRPTLHPLTDIPPEPQRQPLPETIETLSMGNEPHRESHIPEASASSAVEDSSAAQTRQTLPPALADSDHSAEYDLASDPAINSLEKTGAVIASIQGPTAKPRIVKSHFPAEGTLTRETGNQHHSVSEHEAVKEPKVFGANSRDTASLEDPVKNEPYSPKMRDNQPRVDLPQSSPENRILPSLSPPALSNSTLGSTFNPTRTDSPATAKQGSDAVHSNSGKTSSGRAPYCDAVEKIAQRLIKRFVSQPPGHLLLVTSGEIRRFRTAARTLSFSLTNQLKRSGRLTVISTTNHRKITDARSQKPANDEIEASWKPVARRYRFRQDNQLSVADVILAQRYANRLPEDFNRLFEKYSETGDLSIWMVDQANKALIRYLKESCDATVLMVDLSHASVELCSKLATQLQDYGSPLVGSIVLQEMKGGHRWVKS